MDLSTYSAITKVCCGNLFADQFVKLERRKKRGWYLLERLFLEMADCNYQLIGSGSYGIVFASKDSDSVVKIGTDQYDGCPLYLHWCQTQNSRHAPIITEFRVFEYFFWVRMEKLIPIWDPSLSRIVGTWPDEWWHDVKYTDQDMKGVSPSLREYYKLVERTFDSKARLDMHYGNVMYRPSSRDFVITDPLANAPTKFYKNLPLF